MLKARGSESVVAFCPDGASMVLLQGVSIQL
jgi:hypothetical protein